MESAGFPAISAHLVPPSSAARPDPSICPGCGRRMRLQPKSRTGTFVSCPAGDRYICENAGCPTKRPQAPTRRKV